MGEGKMHPFQQSTQNSNPKAAQPGNEKEEEGESEHQIGQRDSHPVCHQTNERDAVEIISNQGEGTQLGTEGDGYE
ncbi:hypothetical protein EVA_14777, partial [gut metagenome]